VINRVREVVDLVSVRNVLLSVADKSGLEGLIEGLLSVNPKVRLYSTGNTHRRVAEILGANSASNLTRVSDYTGQPEMQGGLVKTLDFKIYLGLLSETDNRDHAQDLARTGAVNFDLVVVNLYPFGQAVATPEASCEDARAYIDIGGPAMLRAAAKNYLRVAALCDPEVYPSFVSDLLKQHGATSLRQRFELCRRAFAHTARYDAAISEYLEALDIDEVAATYSAREQ
jgi:phosphoribosylaminoimidazolecarboxamide formyltransferase/IMP cyclohydrolase